MANNCACERRRLATIPGLGQPALLTVVGAAALLVFGGCAAGQAVSGRGPDQPYYVRMSESVLKRSPLVHPKWDYTAGLMLDAIDRVATRTGDAALRDYVTRNVDRLVQPDGTILTYNADAQSLDEIEEGRIVERLWTRTRAPRYQKAVETLREQLRHHPRTSEGGFWHKKIYPQQMWLDGLYMAEPFYAAYARDFNEPTAYDDVALQFLLTARHLRDPKTGLYWHGWDAAHTQIWADKQTGVSPNFWGRALGWYAMALVDVLDILPADHRDRPQLLRLLQDLAPALAQVQDPATGLWYDVLDQPNRAGNYHEASASAMFVYAMAHGVGRGYLPEHYRAVAERGFDGLVRELVKTNADGTLSLTQVCQVSGLGGAQQRDGSYEYYIHEPIVTDDHKGVGAFIMAALELGR